MKKIRFGVVGTNFISDWFLAGAVLDSRFVPVAVCSRDADRGRAFALRHSMPLVFTSIEEMARCADIDAVYIASPNFMHARQSILCMSHGKHVLCEKPLASNAAEARAMIETSERYGVTLMEAMKPTLSPGFSALRTNMERIGAIRRYFAAYCQRSSRYDRFLDGELPNAFNPVCSGGALMDIGVYTIYPMVVLFGKPLWVRASGTVLPSGTDGQGTAMFGYDGMEATIVYSKITDSTLPSEVQGEEGTLSVDRINSIRSVRFTPRQNNTGGGAGRHTAAEYIPFPSDINEYACEASEFASLVLAGHSQSPVNTHSASLTVMEITDEIRRQLGVRFPSDC